MDVSATLSFSDHGKVELRKSIAHRCASPFSPWQGGEGGRRPDEGVDLFYYQTMLKNK